MVCSASSSSPPSNLASAFCGVVVFSILAELDFASWLGSFPCPERSVDKRPSRCGNLEKNVVAVDSASLRGDLDSKCKRDVGGGLVVTCCRDVPTVGPGALFLLLLAILDVLGYVAVASRNPRCPFTFTLEVKWVGVNTACKCHTGFSGYASDTPQKSSIVAFTTDSNPILSSTQGGSDLYFTL